MGGSNEAVGSHGIRDEFYGDSSVTRGSRNGRVATTEKSLHFILREMSYHSVLSRFQKDVSFSKYHIRDHHILII